MFDVLCQASNRKRICTKKLNYNGVWFRPKIRGGGVEVTPGNPRHSHKNVYKSPLPKTKIFEQKATNALPLGAKKCALPSQKVQYFKRVEQKES